MRLPLRESAGAHRRDSYLDRVPASCEAHPAAPQSETIDCVLGCSQWGLSPRAVEALRGFDAEALALYPERYYERSLAPALLERFRDHGVAGEQLFFGHGSFNILERVIHKLVRPGCLIGVGPQFPELPSESRAAGGSYRPVPLRLGRNEAELPLAAIEAAVREERSPLVYVDNPNNPLGCHFPPKAIEELAGVCAAENAVLLVDEALGDFLDDAASCIRLTAGFPNVVVARSFSKTFGLAAERVGYAFFSAPLAEVYRRVDLPFEPGLLAATLARETLGDALFAQRVRRETAAAKARVRASLESAGYQVLPTHPAVSILTARLPAGDAARRLLANGILVQPGSCWARTHAGWDDSYCRLRVPAPDRVEALCDRLRSLHE